MTEVCIVAAEGVDRDLAGELLSSPTARAALSAYDLRRPYANALAVETVSLGAAVALLNDLDWYLTRLARDALVREPSVDGNEFLSRALATAIRDGEVDSTETGDRLKLYGVERRDADGSVDDDASSGDAPGRDTPDGDATDGGGDATSGETVPGGGSAAADDPDLWLVEPLYVTRASGETPAYDLRSVEDTVAVRVAADEFD